jgi:hypothetical protein
MSHAAVTVLGTHEEYCLLAAAACILGCTVLLATLICPLLLHASLLHAILLHSINPAHPGCV